MSLSIYGDRRSGNCLKVLWTVQKLGLEHRWIDIDITHAETRTPDFLAMNPAGQVPLVVFEDGFALAQSNAIIMHLADMYGGGLVPTDDRQRARMYEWLFWEQYSHEPAVAVARFQMAYLGKSREEVDPRLFEKGRAALKRMELGLAGRDWLAADALSLADISLVAYTRVAGEGGFDLEPYPRIRAWIARVEAALGIT